MYQKYRVCLPDLQNVFAHGLSAAKTARAWFSRSQNSAPMVFLQPKQRAQCSPQPKQRAQGLSAAKTLLQRAQCYNSSLQAT